jgi:hypothetical protein
MLMLGRGWPLGKLFRASSKTPKPARVFIAFGGPQRDADRLARVPSGSGRLGALGPAFREVLRLLAIRRPCQCRLKALHEASEKGPPTKIAGVTRNREAPKRLSTPHPLVCGARGPSYYNRGL